jgi:hypothetical protein
LVYALRETAPVLWRGSDLLVGGGPAEYPSLADVVFTSLSADERGVATATWAFNKSFAGPPLVLIDFDVAPFSADLFSELTTRLHAEAVLAHARMRKLVAPAALALQASAALEVLISGLVLKGDINSARALDLVIEEIDPLLRDRDALLLACAAQVGVGRVKLAPAALEKSRRLPCPLFDLRPGVAKSAAIDSVLIGVAAALLQEDALPSTREAA